MVSIRFYCIKHDKKSSITTPKPKKGQGNWTFSTVFSYPPLKSAFRSLKLGYLTLKLNFPHNSRGYTITFYICGNQFQDHKITAIAEMAEITEITAETMRQVPFQTKEIYVVNYISK